MRKRGRSGTPRCPSAVDIEVVYIHRQTRYRSRYRASSTRPAFAVPVPVPSVLSLSSSSLSVSISASPPGGGSRATPAPGARKNTASTSLAPPSRPFLRPQPSPIVLSCAVEDSIPAPWRPPCTSPPVSSSPRPDLPPSPCFRLRSRPPPRLVNVGRSRRRPHSRCAASHKRSR